MPPVSSVVQDELRGLCLGVLEGRVAQQVQAEKGVTLAGIPRLIGDPMAAKRAFKPGQPFACDVSEQSGHLTRTPQHFVLMLRCCHLLLSLSWSYLVRHVQLGRPQRRTEV